jgi:MFS family permease
MRRLLILACSIVFLDVSFFAAIAPLLPGYVDDLDLSKAQAGMLSASYAAGTLVAALPAGLVAARVGPRLTAITGLVVLGLSSLAFGFVDQIALLDITRFCQGAGGAMAWAGAFTWIILRAPEGQRGVVIGTAMGMAVAGELFGPPLGAIAKVAGTELVFGSVLVVATILAVLAARTPDAPSRQRAGAARLRAAFGTRPILIGAGLVAVPSLMFGAIAVLVPLRLDALGGGSAVIAASFATGALCESALSPLVGRYSDRAGRLSPYAIGMMIGAGAMVAIGLGQLIGIVFAATVLAAAGAGFCFTPATAMLADSADEVGLHQGVAAGLTSVAWAGGQVLGGIGGGAAANLVGDAAPSLAVAAMMAFGALAARRLAAAQPATAGPEPGVGDLGVP